METVWEELKRASNGILPVDKVDSSLEEFGVRVLGPAHPVNLDCVGVDRKQQRGMGKSSRMLVHAGLQALADAGIDRADSEQLREIGVIVGTGTALGERWMGTPFDERPPTWLLDTYPNVLLGQLSIAASLGGFGTTIVNACVSATQSIGQGYGLIKRGEADVVLAGGVESKIGPSFISGFHRLNMTSRSADHEAAMRPFDRGRSGFVLGEGACMLVLEEASHAMARNARIQARIKGFGCSMDAKKLTDADADGKTMAMHRALRDAGLAPERIGYINAHGTSTISNDREESIAIKRVFGERAYEIPVSSTKSMIGHSMAACGAIEAAVCVQTLNDGWVHPTRNFQQGDSDCDLDYVPEKARKVDVDFCLTNNSGIGGVNASLILGKA